MVWQNSQALSDVGDSANMNKSLSLPACVFVLLDSRTTNNM